MTTIALARVRDFVDLAIENLVRIEANLRTLGYRFSNKEGAIKRIPVGANASLEGLHRRHGAVPELFYVWYSRVEYVDFSQERTQLLEPCADAVAGLGLNCTLVFESIASVHHRQELLEATGFGCQSADGKEFIPFGTYASNSVPKGIWLPDSSSNPIVYDAGAGPISMADEIMQAVQAGGFPFWASMFSKRRFRSPISNTPRYNEILPALKEGLVDM